MLIEKTERISLNKGQKNKNIYAEKKHITEKTKVHWHSYFELEIIIDGSGTHYLNNEVYNLSRGSVYILNPTDFHRIVPDGALSLWQISFSEDMISDSRLCQLSTDDIARTFTVSEDVLKRAEYLAELIRDESCEEGAGCSRQLCESLLTVLLRSRGERAPLDNEQAKGIKKALIYLDVHFRENPTLEEVALQAGFHKNYFSEIFKKITGENFSKRLNSLKSGYAKMLLSEGFSVTEACYRSGFGSLSNFFTVFKKYVGVSPEEYKKHR